MDIQTLNQEEFDNLHPSMKDYLIAGTDLNPYGSNIVTEKNFFNMNLFSADPYSLDPNLSERTEKARADINYAKEFFVFLIFSIISSFIFFISNKYLVICKSKLERNIRKDITKRIGVKK